jgi:transcriptional regulator with XRE-family HTH domain
MMAQGLTATRSKADFKALRDLLGVTQREIADACAVTPLTVKNWENPGEMFPPSRQAWQWLEDQWREASRRADETVGLARDAGAGRRGPVILTYWRDGAQYRRAHATVSWRFENAVTRITAERLRAAGIEASIMFAETEP